MVATLPVAYVLPTAPQEFQTQTIGSAEFCYLGESPVTAGQGAIAVDNGQTLVSAHKETTLRLSTCVVVLKEGVLALISNDNSVAKVAVVLGSVDSARVFVKDTSMTLSFGQVAIVGSTADDVHNALQSEKIAGRRANTSADGKVMVAEFSIPTLVNRSTLLNKFYFLNDAAFRNEARAILKTSAVLQQVTANHGIYVDLK